MKLQEFERTETSDVGEIVIQEKRINKKKSRQS